MKFTNEHGIVVVEIVCPKTVIKCQNCTCESALRTMGFYFGAWRLSPDAHLRDDLGPLDAKAMLDSATGDVYFINFGWANRRPKRNRKTKKTQLFPFMRCIWCLFSPHATKNDDHQSRGANSNIQVSEQDSIAQTFNPVLRNSPKRVQFQQEVTFIYFNN